MARESSRYALVSEGVKMRKKVYQPTPNGVFACDTSLAFLINQLIEKPDNYLNDKSFNFNFTVIKKSKSSKSAVSKRLEYYKFDTRDLDDTDKIFVNGVVTKGKVNKLVYLFLKKCLNKFDSKATFKNWKKSKHLNKAIKKAMNINILVAGIYQDARDDLEINDDGDGVLFLRYIELGLDYSPVFASFEYDSAEKLLDLNGDEDDEDNIITVNEISTAAIVTRTSLRYLRDFSTAKSAGNQPNLRFIKTKPKKKSKSKSKSGDSEGFWSGVIQRIDVSKLDEFQLARFSDEIREELEDADYLKIEYTFKDTDKIKEKVIDSDDDAILVFVGFIDADIDKPSKVNIWINDDDEKTVTLKATRGTFFNIKNL